MFIISINLCTLTEVILRVEKQILQSYENNEFKVLWEKYTTLKLDKTLFNFFNPKLKFKKNNKTKQNRKHSAERFREKL